MNRPLLVVLLLVTAALCSAIDAGCGVANTKPGSAVIDCLTADRGQIDGLASQLSPLALGAKPDWSAVYQRAKDAGKVVGGCVLAGLVQSYLGGKKATPTDDSWAARNALEKFRTEVAGGATFHTSAGDL